MSNKYKFTLMKRNVDDSYGVSYNWQLVNTHTNGEWRGKLIVDIDEDCNVFKVSFFPLPCTNKGSIPAKGLSLIQHFVHKKIIARLTEYLTDMQYKNI